MPIVDWRAAVRTWERNAPAARSAAPRDETKTMDQVRRLRERISGQPRDESKTIMDA